MAAPENWLCLIVWELPGKAPFPGLDQLCVNSSIPTTLVGNKQQQLFMLMLPKIVIPVKANKRLTKKLKKENLVNEMFIEGFEKLET